MIVAVDGNMTQHLVECSSTCVSASCRELTSVVAMCAVLWAVTLWAKAQRYGKHKRITVRADEIFERKSPWMQVEARNTVHITI